MAPRRGTFAAWRSRRSRSLPTRRPRCSPARWSTERAGGALGGGGSRWSRSLPGNGRGATPRPVLECWSRRSTTGRGGRRASRGLLLWLGQDARRAVAAPSETAPGPTGSSGCSGRSAARRARAADGGARARRLATLAPRRAWPSGISATRSRSTAPVRHARRRSRSSRQGGGGDRPDRRGRAARGLAGQECRVPGRRPSGRTATAQYGLARGCRRRRQEPVVAVRVEPGPVLLPRRLGQPSSTALAGPVVDEDARERSYPSRSSGIFV